MLGLPKATELSRPLPKKAIFDKFKPAAADRQRFDTDIRRLAIVNEVSTATTKIPPGEKVSAFFAVLVSLKTPECDKKNIALLSKLIDQRMLFVLMYGEAARLAAYRADKVLVSESKPLTEWKLPLTGLDLEAVWENAIAQIGGIDLAGGKDLDATIREADRQEKLLRQIATLEKKAMTERQPRKKWGLNEELKRLKAELEGM
jgi:hypothetical protein